MSPPKVHYKIFILVILISVTCITVEVSFTLSIASSFSGADVLFSGEADTLAPTLLKLTDTGGIGGMATGIAVQILDAQSQQEIPLNQVQPLTPLKAGDNTLKYQLRYKSTKAGATGGNATAVLYFDLVYQ